MQIRLALPHEAALVRELMLGAYAEYAATLNPPSSAFLETVDDTAAAMGRGGAVLAFEGVTPAGSGRYQCREGYVYLERLSVLPEFRGRGVATALMAAMEQRARELGHAQTQLAVRMALPRNLDLYKRIGYETSAITPHPRGGDMTADMRKLL